MWYPWTMHTCSNLFLSIRGGWMIFHFSIVQVNFVYCLLNFIVFFPFLIKYYIIFIIIIFWLGCYRYWDFFFMSALLLSILTALFLPSSSVSLPYFVLAVPMHESLGKHSYMSSPCPIAILNGPSFFCEVK